MRNIFYTLVFLALLSPASLGAQEKSMADLSKEDSRTCTEAYKRKNYYAAFLNCSSQALKGEGTQAHLIGKMFEEGTAPVSSNMKTGDTYSQGTSVPEEAYVWYLIAKAQGHKEAAAAVTHLEKKFSKKEKQSLATKAEEMECGLVQATQAWDLGNKCKSMADRGNADAKAVYDRWLLESDQGDKLATYEKAAGEGDIKAQLYLGNHYMTEFREVGKVYSPKEYIDKAVVWFTKAAEAGNAEAQAKLGLIYSSANVKNLNNTMQGRTTITKPDGTKVILEDKAPAIDNTIHTSLKRDIEKGIEWFTKAALQGDTNAQFLLGTMSLQGKDVPEDYEQAYKWMLLASKKQSPMNPLIAESLEHLEKEASPDQLSRARKAAEKIQKSFKDK